MMIVPGHISDLIDLMRIELLAFDSDRYELTTLKRLINESIVFLKLVDPIEMQIIGFSICSNMMGDEKAKLTQAVEIISLAIHPDFQGMGFGKKLLNRTIIDLKRFGVKIIQIYVKTDNEKAISLYKKFNFKILETKKYYYDESKKSAHRMIFRIS